MPCGPCQLPCCMFNFRKSSHSLVQTVPRVVATPWGSSWIRSVEREGQGDMAGWRGHGLCGCPRDQLPLSLPQAFLWAPPGGHCPMFRHSSSVGGDVPGVGGRLVTLHLDHSPKRRRPLINSVPDGAVKDNDEV